MPSAGSAGTARTLAWRKGRPYTLVLTRTDALFTDERNTRATATADLAWLTARWPVTEEPRS